MGLGSCIGVILSDVSTGICGIAHVLLPGASDRGETKYAETAIEKMVEDMVKMGGQEGAGLLQNLQAGGLKFSST